MNTPSDHLDSAEDIFQEREWQFRALAWLHTHYETGEPLGFDIVMVDGGVLTACWSPRAGGPAVEAAVGAMVVPAGVGQAAQEEPANLRATSPAPRPPRKPPMAEMPPTITVCAIWYCCALMKR